jgi:hypothetical protein
MVIEYLIHAKQLAGVLIVGLLAAVNLSLWRSARLEGRSDETAPW